MHLIEKDVGARGGFRQLIDRLCASLLLNTLR